MWWEKKSKRDISEYHEVIARVYVDLIIEPPKPPAGTPPKVDYDGFVVWLKDYLKRHPNAPKPAFLDTIDTTQSPDFILGCNQSKARDDRRPFGDYVRYDPTGEQIGEIIRAWLHEYEETTRKPYQLEDELLNPTHTPVEQGKKIAEIIDALVKSGEVNKEQLYHPPSDSDYPEEIDVQKVNNFEKAYYGEALGDNVIQNQAARDRHTYIVGKSGSGKTTLMRNMIYQDLRLGNGLGVIAPEQEMLTEEILPFIPESRLDDVIYFNPADSNPVPFNPLNLNEGEDLDLKTDETLTIFKRLVGGESGHRMETILRQAIYTLLAIPDTTLLDIPKLLDRANPHFRQQAISQLQDEYTREFWRDTYPQYPKDAHLPIINRLGRFTQPKVIRNTLCQAGKSLNFRELMDTGKVILFNLSDGILGEQNSQLLGQLIVSQFQMATASRANIPQDKRRRFYLYIDEFQTFTGSSTASYGLSSKNVTGGI